MGSLKLGTVFGIDIKVHFTFALALLLGASQFGHFGAPGAAFGVLMTVLLFGCVVLHELSHSVVAQHFGIPVKQIVLLPIGGVAQITRRPETPRQELLIAVAGPLSNVVIAAVLAGVGRLVWGEGSFERAAHLLPSVSAGAWAPTLQAGWLMLLVSNLALAVFNLVPALPMDGGRVLRALLAMRLGTVRGTGVAARVGRVLAVAMIALALLPMLAGQSTNPMLALIGLFVFFGAGAELREAKALSLLEGVRAVEALNPHAVRLSPDTPVSLVMPTLVFTPQTAFEVRLGERLLGVALRHELIEAMRSGQPQFVAGVMRREYPTVPATAFLEEARERMNGALSPFVAVMQQGECLGLITERELAAQAELREMAGDYRGNGVRPAPDRR